MRVPPFPFRKKEKFLLVSISSEGTTSVEATLDKDRNLVIRSIRENKKRSKLLPKEIKVIITVEPRLAHTVIIPLELERDLERSESPIEAIELENLLAQAVGKIFNGYRNEAGTALGADELDVVLAKSRVDSFAVDGHRVMNPLGFRAKKIQAMLEMTFTSRSVLSKVKEFLGGARDFFFTEMGRAQLAALGKVGEYGMRLAAIGAGGSYIFSLVAGDGASRVMRREFPWGIDRLLKTIQRHWSVSESIAGALYKKYCAGEIGERVRKDFEKLFRPEIDLLMKGIGIIKGSERMYLEGEGIPSALLLKRSSKFANPRVGAFLETSGFSIAFKDRNADADALFRILAPFFEFYYDRSDTEINRWLRRRLHWLGSAI